MKRSLTSYSAIAGLALGVLLATVGPAIIAAGSHAPVGNYSYPGGGRRPTILRVFGRRAITSSQQVTFRALLRERNTGRPVARRMVHFRLGSTLKVARTSRWGVATVRMRPEIAPGRYPLRVVFFGSALHAGSRDRMPFQIRWQHRFVDQDEAGIVFLNPFTKDVRFRAEGDDTGVRRDEKMRVVATSGMRLVNVTFAAPKVQLEGEFELNEKVFMAVVATPRGVYHVGRRPGALPGAGLVTVPAA